MNENVVGLLDRLGGGGSTAQLHCECGAAGCTAMATVSRDQYERVRCTRTLVVVARGHAVAGGTPVVDDAGFAVVELRSALPPVASAPANPGGCG